MTEAGPFIVDFDPNLVEIGPLAIRWYALAYIAGLVLGWQYIRLLLRTDRLWATRRPDAFPREKRTWRWKRLPFVSWSWLRLTWDEKTREAHAVRPPARPHDIDDLLFWAALGVILGGRLGYVLIYGIAYCGLFGVDNPQCYTTPNDQNWAAFYLSNPLEIVKIWKGGMAFHGGLLGVILAVILFARARGLSMVRLGDLVACATPVGLFFGRIANFINGELWGKTTTLPWGMVFARELRDRGLNPDLMTPEQLAPYVRHPSQLYEAGLEGLLIFILLFVAVRFWNVLARPGLAIAIFLFAYGAARATGEIFRDSEATLFDNSGVTMGMLLSLPMWALGGFFLWYALSRRAVPAAVPAPDGKPNDTPAKPGQPAHDGPTGAS